MIWTILNSFVFLLIIYIFYIKRETFNISNQQHIPIEEEFNINYFDMTHKQAPTHKTPLYTFSIPIITQTEIYISTGLKGQAYDVFGEKLKKILPLKNQNTNGTKENIELVSQKSVDFGICQEDTVLDARQGIKPFNRKYEELQFICGLFYEYFILLVDIRKNIQTWQDLKGKKVGFTGVNSGSFQNGLKLAKAAGLEPGVDFAYKNVNSINRLMNLFQNQQFDAVYITSTTKNPYLINISKNKNAQVIGTKGISDDVVKTYFPHARKKYINTNSFQDSFESTKFIDTFAIRAILVTNKETDNDLIYSITKSIFSNIDYVKQEMNNHLFNQYLNNLMRDAFMPSDMFDVHFTFPIHNGAKKYYKEIGFIKHIIKED
jgi:TRAP transporter TAXI family solute receptor